MTDRFKSATEYAVFSPGDGQGFVIGEVAAFGIVVRLNKHEDIVYDIPEDRIVARSRNYDILKSNMMAAQALEKLLRPAWQAAVEHELRLRNMMIQAVWDRAKGGLEV